MLSHLIIRFVEIIQRAQTRSLKSIFALTSSTVKGNLLQFIRNVHDFWLPPRCTWDLRSCTLRCVMSRYNAYLTNVHFPQLGYGGAGLWHSIRIGLHKFWKKRMDVVHVWLVVLYCICNTTSFVSLTFVPLTIYGMCIHSILF